MMDLTARKTELQQEIQQAQQQIGEWTKKMIIAQAQRDLLAELEQEAEPAPRSARIGKVRIPPNGATADQY